LAKRAAGLEARRLSAGQSYNDYFLHGRKPPEQAQRCLDAFGLYAITDTRRQVEDRAETI